MPGRSCALEGREDPQLNEPILQVLLCLISDRPDVTAVTGCGKKVLPAVNAVERGYIDMAGLGDKEED